MQRFQVKVIDGPLPPDFSASAMEPTLETSPDEAPVLAELLQREPLFHRPEFGTSRADFERLAHSAFWEVGASGRRYSRRFVLDTLEKRYEHPTTSVWEMQDPHCLKIGPDNYLLTYTLIQDKRVTRRSTIWRRSGARWQVVYHQGTEVR